MEKIVQLFVNTNKSLHQIVQVLLEYHPSFNAVQHKHFIESLPINNQVALQRQSFGVFLHAKKVSQIGCKCVHIRKVHTFAEKWVLTLLQRYATIYL